MTKPIKYSLIIVAVILISGGSYLLAKHTSHTTNSNTGISQTPITGKGSGGSTQTQTQTQSSSGQTSQGSTSQSTQSTNTTNVNLLAPTGQFVSNHTPSMSSAVTSSEASSCNTTPGASCVVTFTNNGVTKSLPSQVTDQYGGTTWSWTVKGIGLTEGAWTVVATASMSGQSKSATDSQMLNVGP